jgi:CheY-like chemotaxis protein
MNKDATIDVTLLPTILVVDDDPDIVEFINQIIKSQTNRAFNVIFSMTGEGAISRINSQKIDALILDIKLPDITGITIAKKVREKFQSIPIAFFTNYTGEAIQKECQALEVFYWYKLDLMANPKKLYDCFEELLNGKSCTDSYASEVYNRLSAEIPTKSPRINISEYLKESRI